MKDYTAYLERIIDQDINTIKNDQEFIELLGDYAIECIKDSTYLISKKAGIDLVLRTDETVSSVHLYSSGFEGMNKFAGRLPHGIDFSYSDRTIHETLGTPNHIGGDRNNPLLGDIPYWEKYYFAKISIHLQYAKDRSEIKLVTISSIKNEPYFLQSKN